MTTRIRTMEQFAEAVGLSRPTVSKYFQDAGSVRAKVRERIEAGLKETGFRPNLFAVNLNRRRSKIIGLIFPTSLDPFYMDLQRRITMEAGAAGYLPFVFSSDGRAELEAEAIETLTSMNVAGPGVPVDARITTVASPAAIITHDRSSTASERPGDDSRAAQKSRSPKRNRATSSRWVPRSLMLQPPLCAGSARHVAGAAGPATQWCSMTEETVPIRFSASASASARIPGLKRC